MSDAPMAHLDQQALGTTTPSRSLDGERGTVRRAPRVRDIDFSRPTKFPPDQERRLERAHESFCRQASTALSAELLADVQLDILAVDQLTWAIARSRMPQPSICGVLRCQPIDTPIVVAAELPLMLQLVERLMGGPGRDSSKHRELTAIETALVQRLFGSLVEQLSAMWQELADLGVSLDGVEPGISNVGIAPPSEPTLVLTVEVRFGRTSSTLTLAYPHRSIEPVLGRLSSGEYGGVTVDPGDAASLRARVSKVDVELRAEVASKGMTVDEVLALRPGDVLRFDAPATNGIRLFAGQVPVHRGRPGRNGNRRAVQIANLLSEEP